MPYKFTKLIKETSLQEKTATGNGEIVADEGFEGLSKVIVAIPEDVPVYQNKTATENGTYTADEGYDALSSVTVNVPDPVLQEKTVTPTKSEQTVVADSGKDGLSAVVVGAIPDEYIKPEGSLTITENMTVDVTEKKQVVVNVPSEASTLTTKQITANGTYNASEEGADGYSKVIVNVAGGGGSATLIEKTVTANGTYNASSDNADGYSKVTVNVAGGGGNGEPIEVSELPTENINPNAIYKIESSFSDVIFRAEDSVVSGNEYVFQNFGITPEYYTVDTKPTENIRAFDDTTMIVPIYYVKDENDLFVYGDDGTGTGTNGWGRLIVMLSLQSVCPTFNGSIADISEATETGYYALDSITLWKYSEDSNIVVDMIAVLNGQFFYSLKEQAEENGIEAFFYYVDTTPTENIKVSTESVIHWYYIEDINQTGNYTEENGWDLADCQALVTERSQATKDGRNVLVTHMAELLIPTGSTTITENGTHDVTRVSSANVNVQCQELHYIGFDTVDDLPSTANEGTLAIVGGYRLLTAEDVGKTFGTELDPFVFINIRVKPYVHYDGYLLWEPWVCFNDDFSCLYFAEDSTGSNMIYYVPGEQNDWQPSEVATVESTSLEGVTVSGWSTKHPDWNNWLYVKAKGDSSTMYKYRNGSWVQI